MLNNTTVGSKVLSGVFFAALFAVFGLASCGSGGGGSTSTNTTPTTTTPATGGIVLSLVPARTSGVAPLAVFFDASATTNTGVTTRPFHDLEYIWSFGDPSSGTWASGAQPGISSKNSTTGPVASHVFETPGTYTVSLTAFDGTNTATTNTTITVTDPNTVFSGTNTICVAQLTTPTAGENGCPAGALPATQSSFATAVNTYALTGKRVLFKRGDVFTAATPASIVQTGPGTVGAYGSGAAPVVQMTGSSGILSLSSQSTPNISDWRIMDLEFDGLNQTSGIGISGGGGINQVLVLNIHMHDIYLGVSFNYALLDSHISNNHPGHTIFDQIAIVGSTITPNTGNGTTGSTSWRLYIAAQHLAILGNTLGNVANTDAMGSHTIRTGYIGKGVISNNVIARPGALNNGTLAIKMHAPPWCDATSPAGECLTLDTTPTLPSYSYLTTTHPIGVFAATTGYTEQVVVSDNKIIGGSGPYLVVLGPQHTLHDERVRDVIVERNWFKAGNNATQAALVMHNREITARNNICDMTEGSTGGICFHASLEGVSSPSPEPPPDNVRIYNNTAYKSGLGSTSEFSVVKIDAYATNVTVRNNLAYGAGTTSSWTAFMVNGTGASGLIQSNNSTPAQMKNTLPGWVSATPAVPADFSLAAGSYAREAGLATVPVLSDFFRTSRPQNGVMDIGAVEGH
jgi:PKD repeat protein